jgi:hypothetical protein
LNFIATLSTRAGSANIFVYNSSVHIPDSFKLVEEFHGQLKIGGGGLIVKYKTILFLKSKKPKLWNV